MIGQSRLMELLRYDETTGLFTRSKATNNRVKVGDICGFIDVDGYRRVRVDKKLYLAHRLAWFYVNGEWPEHEIDHRDGDRDNNRIANLRCADRYQNAANMKAGKPNATGYRGVTFNKRSGRYEAAITARSERFHLGTFDTPIEAHTAYVKASVRLHGEYGRAA